MYSYALSLGYRCAEDPKWFEAMERSKVRRFEFSCDGSQPPEAYAEAVGNLLEAADTGVEAASIHIPFGNTPWVPARESERAETLEAIRGLMKVWAPLHPPRFTLHGGSEADKELTHAEQIRALRVFSRKSCPTSRRPAPPSTSSTSPAPASATRPRSLRRSWTAFLPTGSASAST